MRIFKGSEFSKFARREDISDQKLIDAIKRAESGLIDADYGGGLIKQRISRLNEGKSGGYRSIVIYQKGDKAFFVYGFAKNERENITQTQKNDFKKLARALLSATEEQLKPLLDKCSIEEIRL